MFELTNPLKIKPIHEMSLSDCKDILDKIRATRMATFHVIKQSRQSKNPTKKSEKLVTQLEKLLLRLDSTIDKISETITHLELLQFQSNAMLFSKLEEEE